MFVKIFTFECFNSLKRYELSEKMLAACSVLKSHLGDPKTVSSKDLVSGF